MVPLRFKFEQESAENSLREGNRLMSECEELNAFHDINSQKPVSFDGLPKMVDGKVKFTWSQVARSMQNCYICGASWRQMAHRHGNFTPDRKALSFGFSNLHVKMRAFEWVCKAACYRRVKAYECRGDDNKKLKEEDKAQLRTDFRTEFGRVIYGRKPNDGNIAKLAFSKPDVLARITGVPESLIYGLKTALDAVDCKHKISPQLYSAFANRWLDDFHTSTISWNVLSPTVHMLFVHGSDILRESPLAPGFLSG